MAEDGKFQIEKFDGTDFSWWKMQIEDLLVQKDLDVVLGDKPEKMSDADWAGLDRKAMSVIRLSLTKNVAFNILKEKTTKGIMEALSNMYEKPSAANKVFLIRELVNTRMKNGTSVTEHINKLNSILARLLSVGIKFDDKVQALLLLSSLPDTWSVTVTAVTSSAGPDGFTFEKIRDLVLGEDVRRRSSGESLEESLNIVRVLKTPVSFWTLKDVRVVPALKKSLISVRQLDEQGHEVKFGNGQWKVVKGNLVMARGRKRGSLYMVELPSEGVTVPIQKKNEVRFTESRGQKKVFYARKKPRATGHTQDERARKGSMRPVRENFLLSMEIVCSQDVPGSGSACVQWEPVGTEDESGMFPMHFFLILDVVIIMDVGEAVTVAGEVHLMVEATEEEEVVHRSVMPVTTVAESYSKGVRSRGIFMANLDMQYEIVGTVLMNHKMVHHSLITHYTSQSAEPSKS
ncbi:unnamed protein product [Cuscuta campestris]|uniref:Retrovirus-related Pol polyprotein from transposon TNT 1-94 n=1 Tax=Cuscuta campestris TaxID=132261 RepID=A0A484N4U8_9ASTE|nr:unnamed protein product [Cuscuta campestris]